MTGLCGNQVHAAENLSLEITQLHRANRQALIQVRLDTGQRIAMCDRIFLPCLRCSAETLIELALDGLKIGKRQFGVDGLDVIERVYRAGNVRYVIVLETTHYVCNRVGLADVGEKLVT